MKHVIAFDVSKGKSTIVIYNEYRQCEFEGNYITRASILISFINVLRK